ncbi:hypothetical protein BD289DRAFT_434888 [Coniella lustricola]|uniref:Uncharacterized protein n=1 Tax=Coniella lustricola TaxID=2025994 RepID=A0A2T3A6X0_9PEZI|nr:hypothetical protein BD289DRAFT_434888 [Coniella lustricola]
MKIAVIWSLTAMIASVCSESLRVSGCSSTSSLPCECSAGTDYWESVTTEVIGASAEDVGNLINDFFNCGWLGAVPYKTKGQDNTVGAIRTSQFETLIGEYDVSEKLIEYEIESDGSFIQRFEQLSSTIPLKYHTGNGSFSGYWVTLQGKYIFEAETLVVWSIYACETGHARNFALFHEGALKNATSILQAQNKLKGITVGPVSAQNFTT